MGRKSHLIETTEEKIKLCDDIINAGEAHSSQVLGQLYHDLEAIRPQLFRLTAETEDDNDELMLILRLTDEVTRIINVCKEKYPQAIAAAAAASSSTSSATTTSPANELLIATDEQSARLQELGCDLDLLGMDAPATTQNNDQKPKSNPIDDLQQLNKAFMQSQFGYTAPAPTTNGAATLVDLTAAAAPPTTVAPPKSAAPAASNAVIAPLTGITVPVTDFKPSKGINSFKF